MTEIRRKEGEMVTELIRVICIASGASKVELGYSEHEDCRWEAKATWGGHDGLVIASVSCHDDDATNALRGLSRKIRNNERDR
jgi:hypothetical protein